MAFNKNIYTEDSQLKNTLITLMVVGGLGLAGSFLKQPVIAWINILTLNFYFLCIALFGVFMLALTNIVGASFIAPYRRVLEALAGSVPYLCLSMLIILLGSHTLYEWTHTDIVLKDHILIQKMSYLNLPFFGVRMVICMLAWSGMAWFFRKKSKEQDEYPERAEEIQKHLQGFSAIGMIVFALTFCIASFDWIMSLEPHWFSTIFGIYTFSGLMVSGIAFTILAIIFLKNRGYLQEVNENHYHDLGKFLLAFSTFWAYIWYSQYLLIWYANIPEEGEYYVLREHFGWDWLFWLNLVINWALPFLMLLPRSSKRNPTFLKRVCWMVLVGQWLNVFLLVAPKVLEHNSVHHPTISWPEIFITLGYTGVFLTIFLKQLAKFPLIPKNCPYLEEGIALEQ
ncbi:MAG: hypothetical protein AB7I27_01925 [Bacteriovoracaceae bacterium]